MIEWTRDGRDWISGRLRITRTEPHRHGDPNYGRFLVTEDGRPVGAPGHLPAAKRLAARFARLRPLT